jgi:hypothetical protein
MFAADKSQSRFVEVISNTDSGAASSGQVEEDVKNLEDKVEKY